MTYRTARIGVDILDTAGNVVRNIRRAVQGDAAAWRDYQAWLDAGTDETPHIPAPMPVPAPVTAADEAYKREARRQIDEAAGRARARYITVAPGQDATYQAKYLQALSYVAAGYPAAATPYPWIASEAAATGLTVTQTADRIKALGDAWAGVIGPAIEGARIAGKDALEPLTTRAEVQSAVAAARATLGAI